MQCRIDLRMQPHAALEAPLERCAERTRLRCGQLLGRHHVDVGDLLGLGAQQLELRCDLAAATAGGRCRRAAAENCAARPPRTPWPHWPPRRPRPRTVDSTRSAPRTRGLPISAVTRASLTTAATRCRNSSQAGTTPAAMAASKAALRVGAGGGRELAHGSAAHDILRELIEQSSVRRADRSRARSAREAPRDDQPAELASQLIAGAPASRPRPRPAPRPRCAHLQPARACLAALDGLVERRWACSSICSRPIARLAHDLLRRARWRPRAPSVPHRPPPGHRRCA